jgi:hypothetical protein
MPEFIQGIELARAFFQEAVQPILVSHFPGLPYAAALLGSGSEILGYDTEMSSDHHWGPRVILFLNPPEKAAHTEAIRVTLSHHLPYTFRGYSTHFSPPDPTDNGVQWLEEVNAGPVNHRVEIYTLHEFVENQLGFDLNDLLTPADWLSFPQQKLLTLTAGAVYHDGIGLENVREKFAYYPHDVWLYMLVCGWSRIGQDEHLAPRAGYAGDELGSAVIAGRLVRSIMQLCFLMEQKYAPYPKWVGTGFSGLACSEQLTPALRAAQMGETWQDRERALVQAYEQLGKIHNALGITERIEPPVHQFFGRPFLVSNSSAYIEALKAKITDAAVKAILERTVIGNIDQYSDNTDMRENTRLREVLRRLYD